MYTLFTDKGEDFKCNIGVEGASLSNTIARLVLESKDLNLLFQGTINNDGTCVIPIKKLKNILPEGTQGRMKLEVVADDTFFSPWEDDFQVNVNKKVTVEVLNDTRNTIKENTINVQISGINKSNKPTKKVVSSTPKKSHSEMIGEVLTNNGVTLDNFDKHHKKVQKIVESYVKKHKIKTDTNDLMNEIIINLK